MQDITEFSVQKQINSDTWETISLWNSPDIARNRALELWEKEPESRPNVRVIRLGARQAAYLFVGGLFSKAGGKWRRILRRRMR